MTTPDTAASAETSPDHAISFAEAVRVWLKIGLTSFGGPAGQIAQMHRVLVEDKHWVGEVRFLHALNYCMLLPGPEAQQLAIYMGWLLHRIPGGVVAGWLFVLPGFLVLLTLSVLYAGFHDLALVQGLFFGLKPAVLAVVVEAVLRIGRRACRHPAQVALAGLAFLAIGVARLPFPVVVLAAGAIGLAGSRLAPQVFAARAAAASPRGPAVVDAMMDAGIPAHARPNLRRAVVVAAVCLALWWGPTLVLAATLGWGDTFTRAAVFFSKMAVVTFGGAYAVLAYVAQQAVETYGWLGPGEMLDGLGLAETTPGPLILVLEFVGFLAGYRSPGALPPMLAGTLSAVLTVWVTFVPCFLWIFLGGPYVEALRGNRALAGALAAITAAVVGVILNLAVWFGLHVLFARVDTVAWAGLQLDLPVWASVDAVSAVLAGVAMLAMLRFHVGMVTTLAACAGLGLVWRLVVAPF